MNRTVYDVIDRIREELVLRNMPELVSTFDEKFNTWAREKFEKDAAYMAPEVIAKEYWLPLSVWLTKYIPMNEDPESLSGNIKWIMTKYEPKPE